MLNNDLQDNQKIFLDLINQLANLSDEKNKIHIQHYIQHNIIIINRILAISNENLIKIKDAGSNIDIICIQSRLFNEIRQKLSILNQHYLHEVLGHHADDHDAWIEAHCDFATD